MHEPGQFRRNALVLTLAMWAFHFVLLSVRASMSPPEYQMSLGDRAQITSVGFFVCVGVYFVLERMQSQRYWLQVLVTHVLVAAAAVLYAWLRMLMMGGDWPLTSLFDVATYWLWFYLAWAWTLLALSYRMRVTREERMRILAEGLAHQAKLETLRYQLNPHFLFNTLNSIAALVLARRIEDAELMLRRLSDFLRGGLAVDPLTDVELKDELAQQKLYLDIELVRFPSRMRVFIDVAPTLERALVPSLIIQPLIENSIKHAVARSRELVTIRIVAESEAGALVLTVADDGAVPRAVKGLGVGLENVRSRLEAKYGAAGRVEAHPMEKGFMTVLRMPLQIAR